MKAIRFLVLICVFCAFALLGCSQRMIDFTIISSKNIDLSRAASFTKGSERVEGKDTRYIIFFFPTGIPNVKEATDRAIEKIPGCVALVDGVVEWDHFYIPLIFGQTTYTIEGTCLIDKTQLKASNPLNQRFTLQMKNVP